MTFTHKFLIIPFLSFPLFYKNVSLKHSFRPQKLFLHTVANDYIEKGEAQIAKLSLLSFKEIKQLLWGIYYIHFKSKSLNECMLNKTKQKNTTSQIVFS